MSDWKPDCVYAGTEYKTLFKTDNCAIIVSEAGVEAAVKIEWVEPLKGKSLRESIIDTAVEAVFARRIEGNLSPTLCRQICEALYDANAFRMPTNEYKGIKEGEINFVSETFPYKSKYTIDDLSDESEYVLIHKNNLWGFMKKPD